MKINYLVFTKEMAEWLRKTREALKVSQDQVGLETKLGQGYISKHERGAVQKMSKDGWLSIVAFYTKRGAKPIEEKFDPIKITPDPKQLLKDLRALKKETGSSWVALASTLKVDERDLVTFQAGKMLGTDRVIAIHQGLVKLKGLPQKLADEGVVSAPKDETKKTKKKKNKKKKKGEKLQASTQKKKSVIEKAVPNAAQTRAALIAREIELTRLLRSEVEQHQLGNILNGSTMKFLHG